MFNQMPAPDPLGHVRDPFGDTLVAGCHPPVRLNAGVGSPALATTGQVGH